MNRKLTANNKTLQDISKVCVDMDFNVPTFVKWAGGKRQLLPKIVKFMPKNFNNYIEPFVGGGTVYFFVQKNFDGKAIISDINKELILTFEVIRDNPTELINLLKIHRSSHNEEYFYKIRALDVEKLTPVEISARFIYLNKTCFNGLYRVNSKGKFNVPIGSYKNPSIFNETDLMIASKLLKRAKIDKLDFRKTVQHAKKGDFIYFDPPYYPLSRTSNFTSYTKEAFLEKEQTELAEAFRELDKKGCFVMLSNSDCEFIRNLYKGFNIHVVKARRAISCIGSKRGKINELIVTNY